jgi:L-seryl-tRNA(Ser) seleniumtransferase
MLRTSAGELRERCDALAEILRERGWLAETVAVRSVVGGGTTPGATLSGFAVALRHPAMTESELSSTLRCLDPPVIARTRRGRVLLDLRTVSREDDAVLLRVLTGLEPRA